MKYNLTIFFLFFSLLLHAQHPCYWDLTIENGLPSLEVYDLYEDSKGYMWIGTDKGLCKYNGRTFTYYKNKKELSEALSGIQEDPEGRIWVRNFKDQIFYIEDDSLHCFELPHEINIQDFLVDSKGSIWVIENKKDSLYNYSDKRGWKSWRTYYADSTLSAYREGPITILEGDNNVIYLTTRSGLFKCVDDQVHFVTNENLMRYKSGLIGIINTFLFKDKENNIFLLQYGGEHFYQINQLLNDQIHVIGNSFREYFYKKNNHNLKFDEENTIWQLTADGGLGPIFNSKFPNKLDSTLLLFHKEGISDFLIDREGNYWVGSLSKGVHIIPNLSVQEHIIANSSLTYNRVGAIEKKDEKTLFVSTEKENLFSYDTEKNKIIGKNEISKGECTQLLWDQTNLLINGKIYQEAYKFLSESTQKYEFASFFRPFRSSFIYKKKWIVSVSEEGISVYTLSESIASKKMPDWLFPLFKQTKFGDPKIERYCKQPSLISSFYGIPDEANDRILIARDDSLICYPERGKPFPVLDEKGSAIRGIYMDRSPNGIIWICTVNRGIYALNKEMKVINHFTVEDGLINNRIKKLKIDGENLCLLSAHGIQRFNYQTKESHIYTTKDGLPTHEIKDIAIVGDKVWLSTAKGLVSLDKNTPSKNEVAPLIYIKQVSIHDKDTLLSDVYNLSYEQNSITITIEGLAYRSRGAFKYKYRMLGIDTVWRYQDAEVDFIRFPQLESGKYTFEVKAVNEDGVESMVAAQVVFDIGLPYWRTWWFILIITFSLGLVVLFIIRIQLRQARLESQNSNLKMEALQSQMNPHFIFNVLTAVQNLWLQHKNELAMDLQSNFAKLLRKIFQYSSKRAITIEQVEEFLNNYLNLEQIRFENKVDIDFQIEEVLIEEEYMIPPLLIQPIIENSFKHGLFHKQKDLKLKIHLKRQGAYLYCCVEDNGVGRNNKAGKKKIKRSSGLSTTKERLAILQESTIKAKHLHNNLKITDLKDSNGIPTGTKVELWIPFVDKI